MSPRSWIAFAASESRSKTWLRSRIWTPPGKISSTVFQIKAPPPPSANWRIGPTVAAPFRLARKPLRSRSRPSRRDAPVALGVPGLSVRRAEIDERRRLGPRANGLRLSAAVDPRIFLAFSAARFLGSATLLAASEILKKFRLTCYPSSATRGTGGVPIFSMRISMRRAISRRIACCQYQFRSDRNDAATDCCHRSNERFRKLANRKLPGTCSI